ncbi:MAG: tRNA (N(6)-L-threonylcarbamoyladenosine(37)-C(2))-methylthiotransferase MtaB [Clostridia bacterium]|nr:tRNA (N(6)-L-threonylcarbamoyladenosine(37)-C(2))-methylthiotransferase MtaB [Clostridia bacterium]
MAKKVAICTLGCKVNTYESEAVKKQFENHGYISVDFSDSADVYIINTCTVTHLGDRKSRQMIRRTKQINPYSTLVVMGCYAQVAPDEVEKIEEVDIIVGTAQKAHIYDAVAEFLENNKKQNLVCDISHKTDFEELEVTSYEGRTRAILKIQDGCNNFCSYCIIPYARGRIRSRSIESSVNEAKRLAAHGFCEIVLVGIHIASFGRDTGESLIDLLTQLNNIDGIKRIRMGSLEPTLFSDEFTQKLSKLPKICRHFHLSLQSGCDETLKRMNRKYTTADYMESVKRIRTAFEDAAITTDIMVGFPGETDAEFDSTMKFIDEVSFAEAHIFKYSIRRGTVAEKMPNQVAPEVKEERSKRLIELTKKTHDEFLTSHIDKEVSVLFEREYKGKKGYYEGKTDNYITVIAKSDTDVSGEIKGVKIHSVKKGVAEGTILS